MEKRQSAWRASGAPNSRLCWGKLSLGGNGNSPGSSTATPAASRSSALARAALQAAATTRSGMTDVPSPAANPTVILIESQQPFYFFFPSPRASPLSISSQWFSSLFLTTLILPQEFPSPFEQCLYRWCLGIFLLLLNRNFSQTRFGSQAPPLFQPWVLILVHSLNSADDSIAGIKKGDRKMESWSPEDQKQAGTPGT